MTPRTSNASATASRRSQIIEATIDTIAEIGMPSTTFSQIATRGELSSTRLISYHFDSKTTLIEATVAHIYRSIDDFLSDRSRIDPASRPIQSFDDESPASAASARDELFAYISGVAEYIDGHRHYMRALQAIFAASHTAEYDPAALQADPRGGALNHLQGVLRRGQNSGEFRAFDPLVIAAMIQRPLEALSQLLASDPSLDVTRYAQELSDAVDRATRADPA